MIYNIINDGQQIKQRAFALECNSLFSVIEAVKRLQSHAPAVEIYGAIVTEHPNLSGTAVYWNLKIMRKTGNNP